MAASARTGLVLADNPGSARRRRAFTRWPHLLLPQLHCLVVTLERTPGRLPPRPSVTFAEPLCPLHCVADVEQPPGQRLHPGQRPSLIRPAMNKRATLQLLLQLGNLRSGQPRTAGRAFRPETLLAALPRLTSPALHRPRAHAQRSREEKWSSRNLNGSPRELDVITHSSLRTGRSVLRPVRPARRLAPVAGDRTGGRLQAAGAHPTNRRPPWTMPPRTGWSASR